MTKTIEITFPIDADLAPELIAAFQEIIRGRAPVAVVKATPPASPAAPTFQAPTTPAVPGTPIASPTTQTANRDNTGVPFNAEIHAPSGRLSAKGEWTLKKGVDKVAADNWKKGHAALNTAVAANRAAPAPVPTPAELNAQFGAPAWPAAPAALGSVHYPPVPYNTFGALYAKLANEGKITGADVATLMAESGASGDPSTYVTDDAKRAHAFALLQKFDV